ncbi:MAG: efflux RND transporter periplasmic adaptor subunit [Treponema sp.]|jgi:RND family efflux transporter MFP subunit|nr:efflux RND transporter periplasmic adaptor subunit [Treponema sp.]
MKKHILLISQLILIIGVSCNKQNTGQIEPVKVKGAAASVRELPDEASGFGSLSFVSKLDITTAHDAVIKKIYFREGDFVKEGDLLLKLDNPQIELAVERAQNNYSQSAASYDLARSRLLEGMFQAEAQLLILEKAAAELEFAKKKWEEDKRKHQNQETLFDAGAIQTEAILVSRFGLDSEWEQIQLMERELHIKRIGIRDQDLEAAGFKIPKDEKEKQNTLVSLMTMSLKAELDAAQARLEASNKELLSALIAQSELKIFSSASGYVGVRYFEDGERVRQQDKILSLIDTTSLYAIFPIREKDAIRIKQGMKATVMIDSSGETREGHVDLLYPQADIQSLSFLVRVLLQENINKDILKPGMFARVTVTLGPVRRIACIPESSVIKRKNKEGSVFVINGSSLVERNIILGEVYDDEYEVVSGLNAGDLVVIRPDSALREGIHVTLI